VAEARRQQVDEGAAADAEHEGVAGRVLGQHRRPVAVPRRRRRHRLHDAVDEQGGPPAVHAEHGCGRALRGAGIPSGICTCSTPP
jgi:hypothetical protein